MCLLFEYGGFFISVQVFYQGGNTRFFIRTIYLKTKKQMKGKDPQNGK